MVIKEVDNKEYARYITLQFNYDEIKCIVNSFGLLNECEEQNSTFYQLYSDLIGAFSLLKYGGISEILLERMMEIKTHLKECKTDWL